MRRIVYRRPDGGVSIVNPAPKAQRHKETEADFLARLRLAIPQDATDIHECDDSEIPTDRTYRGAWKRGPAAAITVDMTKARGIHRDRLRAARRPKFTELDALWMKATATGDTEGAAATEAERQRLRDLPQDPALDAAKTPEDLKATWPEGL